MTRRVEDYIAAYCIWKRAQHHEEVSRKEMYRCLALLTACEDHEANDILQRAKDAVARQPEVQQ